MKACCEGPSSKPSGADRRDPRSSAAPQPERSSLLRKALGLEALTVGWNVVEGVIAVAAALASGSVALLGFGIDSFVESASGSVLIWRLVAERRANDHAGIERLEKRALRLVGASLFGLAAFVAFDAVKALWHGERPDVSVVGIVLTSVSLAVMIFLARAKLAVARALGSRAMEADAFQTTACWWLSLVTLVGIGMNALFGLWWADPVAALAVAALVAKEGREAWEGRDCCG